jgi:hypothetical protein
MPIKLRLIMALFTIISLPFRIIGWVSKLLGLQKAPPEGIDDQVKMYYMTPNDKSYWEVWGNRDGGFTIHWGALGDRGETKDYTKEQRETVLKMMDQLKVEGFRIFEHDDFVSLDVVWAVDGFGSKQDLEKRYAAQDLLNEELGWLGLGHSFDASIGSDEMEVGCEVADAEIGKACIAKILNGTEFSDYVRIELLE